MPDFCRITETRGEDRVYYRIEASNKQLAQAEVDRLCELYCGYDYRTEFRRPFHHPVAGHWSATVDRYLAADEKILGSSTE